MLVTLSAGCQTPLSLLRQRETTNTPFDVSQGDQHIPLFGENDALRQSFAHLLQGGELLIGQRFQTKRSYTEKICALWRRRKRKGDDVGQDTP